MHSEKATVGVCDCRDCIDRSIDCSIDCASASASFSRSSSSLAASSGVIFLLLSALSFLCVKEFALFRDLLRLSFVKATFRAAARSCLKVDRSLASNGWSSSNSKAVKEVGMGKGDGSVRIQIRFVRRGE